MKVKLAVTVGAAVVCSEGTGVSRAVLVAVLEAVPFPRLVNDVVTDTVEGTISADEL